MNTIGEESTPPGTGMNRDPALDAPAAKVRPSGSVSFLALWALAIFGRSRQARDADDPPRRDRGPPP